MILWLRSFLHGNRPAPATRNAPPPPEFFILMPVLWLCWMGMWIIIVLAAIIYGVKSRAGRMGRVPVFRTISLQNP